MITYPSQARHCISSENDLVLRTTNQRSHKLGKKKIITCRGKAKGEYYKFMKFDSSSKPQIIVYLYFLHGDKLSSLRTADSDV